MTRNAYAVVESNEASLVPYPYIYVNEDGSYRELSKDEMAYLEEEFSPFDGGRPYVKGQFWQMTPDRKLSGFLHRKKLLWGLNAGEVPGPKKWWEFWRP